VSDRPADRPDGGAIGELIADVTGRRRIYDLGLPLFQGMPSGPTHPPFVFSLTKLHGDVTFADGASSANDLIAMGCHVGTHVDALGHVSRAGVVSGGREVGPLQSLTGGLREVGIDATGPIVTRGVLLDIAALRGVPCLEGTEEIGAADLEAAAAAQGVEVRPGDSVLIRTGWARHWPDAQRYQGHPAPGPTLEAARWLVSRGVAFTGSDTPAYEKTPARGLAVHLALMVDASVQIIEMLDLEQLAADGIAEFLFVALPLKIVGGTASPIRPIAIA
jgi:kynurenine formamidase